MLNHQKWNTKFKNGMRGNYFHAINQRVKQTVPLSHLHDITTQLALLHSAKYMLIEQYDTTKMHNSLVSV